MQDTTPSRTLNLYHAVRTAEERVYDDGDVLHLPTVPRNHRYAHEWKVRRQTLAGIRRYLYRRRPESVLELGCGNGWLTARLAEHLTQTRFCGIDPNQPEIEQARRVFNAVSNVSYKQAGLMDLGDGPEAFDVILIPSALQYFPTLGKPAELLESRLSPGGEIHILDTPLYPDEAARQAAAARSRDYYTQLGFPEMADHYFHHTLTDVSKAFSGNLRQLSFGMFTRHPFPWLRLGPYRQ